jgi:hypothetical protein
MIKKGRNKAMKKFFTKPINLKIRYAIGFTSIYTDIIGISYNEDGFVLIQDLGDFEAFYDADTGEEITLDFKMDKIKSLEIVE